MSDAMWLWWVMHVRIIHALAPAAKLSGSYFAPEEKSAWHESAMKKYSACTGSHCVTLLHTTWQRKQGKGSARYHAIMLSTTMESATT